MLSLNRRSLLRGKPTTLAPSLPWTTQAQIETECTRCGDCISACEEAIIVKADGGFPRIDFKLGGCTSCYACVNVCQAPVFQTERTDLWPAQIEIKSSCLTYSGVYCQSCRDACDQNAIHFLKAKIPTPIIDTDACNSCGACISVCPTEAIQWRQVP